ncbi:MAG: ABC-type lipoprotein export system ATPase subunit [Bacteroidia bacterium]|jgi:ABC-type lipoprotein export system ATPase subunit
MNEEAKKIKRVEIKSLWGKHDLAWDLNPDVNILSGINGSRKSTVLNAISAGLSVEEIPINVEAVEIKFNGDNQKASYASEGFITRNFNRVYAFGEFDLLSTISNYFEPSKNAGLHELDGGYKVGIQKQLRININLISTFDQEIFEEVKLPNKEIKTELDWQINNLQNEYLDYQLDIGKRAFKAISNKKSSSQKEVLQIKQRQDRFIEIVNDLFKETEKRIDEEENELSFLLEDEILSPYQLSAGEKQLLVILMTVLVQDDEPSILLMDEPEISLHFDWQKKLIGYILELNPNVQIIIATHSPALIIEGWTDKVFEMKNLIVKETATAQ